MDRKPGRVVRILSVGDEGLSRITIDAVCAQGAEWSTFCSMGETPLYNPRPEYYFVYPPSGGLVEGASPGPSSPRYRNASMADATLVLCESHAYIPTPCKSIMSHLRKEKGAYLVADPWQRYSIGESARWISENGFVTINVSAAPGNLDPEQEAGALEYFKSVIHSVHMFRWYGIQQWAASPS